MYRWGSGECEIAATHGSNHSDHIPWIAWAIYHRWPADYQPAAARAALPATVDEFSGIFRSSVRRDWTDRRILIGWSYGRAIDANAAGEIQVSTIDRFRIRADV